MNNPLMYTNPRGELFMFLGLGVLFWKAVIIGAAVGLASYTVGLAVTGNLHQWNIGGALKATFFGALGGAASFGVGSIFSAAGEAGKAALTAIGHALEKSIGGFGLAVVQAGTHALSQGILGLVQGGDFLSSAVAGFAGSLGASGWGSVMGSSGGAMIAFGALSGGVGAELTGGNFWQGAITGGIVAGLNHSFHKIKFNGEDPKVSRPTFRRKEFAFSKTQVAYGLSEGTGFLATYTIEGVIAIEGNTITVSAFGSTPASLQNSVFFRGEVTVRGTAEYTLTPFNNTVQLQKDYSKPYIYNLDKPYIGKASIILPSHIKSFNVSVSAGYIFKNGDNLPSMPVPAQTTYSQGFKR